MLLALALWIGGIIFFGAVVAPTLFGVLPTHDLAGKVVNPALAKLHWMGLTCGIVFLLCSMSAAYSLRGSVQLFAPRHLAVLLMLALTVVSQYVVAKKMLRVRDSIGVIDNVSPTDARRVEFNRLHVWSTRLEGGVLVLGLGVLWGASRRLS
jgi:hypothetical protein